MVVRAKYVSVRSINILQITENWTNTSHVCDLFVEGYVHISESVETNNHD